MKIAFDIHGTLDTHKVLRTLAQFLTLDVNNVVYIISGPEHDVIAKRLEKLGIDPSRFTIISIVDYLRSKGVKFHMVKSRPFCDEDKWWTSKGDICREQGIELIFDDSIQYEENMPETTTFVLC